MQLSLNPIHDYNKKGKSARKVRRESSKRARAKVVEDSRHLLASAMVAERL